MKCNVGPMDRLVRVIIGFVIVILGVVFDSWWGLVGFVPLVTGLFRFCPLYVPLNINTGEEKK